MTHNPSLKVLLIFAHPDDETFGSGGTIAKMHKAGAVISLITATFGQAGQTGEYGDISPEELGKIRKKEQEEACKILGVSKVHHFGLMDGELYNHQENPVFLKRGSKKPVIKTLKLSKFFLSFGFSWMLENFQKKTPDFQSGEVYKYRVSTLVKKILPIMEEEDPDVVITFGKGGGSNHPDHKKMSAAATRAFKEYAGGVKKRVSLYHTVMPKSHLKAMARVGIDSLGSRRLKGVRDDNVTTVVDILDTFQIKKKAALCHKSQMKDIKRLLKIAEAVGYKREFFSLILENRIFR